MGKKPGVELVRNPGLSVGGGPSSSGVHVTASVAPGWSDREASLTLPAVGVSHQPWNGYGLSSFFKCLSWSPRRFCVSLSIFTREYQIIYQLCWHQKEMNFKAQLYEAVIFSC